MAVYRYHERELLKKKLRESEGIKDEKENHVSSKTFLNNHKSADNYCDQKQSKIPVKSLSRHRSNVQKFKEIQNSIEKVCFFLNFNLLYFTFLFPIPRLHLTILLLISKIVSLFSFAVTAKTAILPDIIMVLRPFLAKIMNFPKLFKVA